MNEGYSEIALIVDRIKKRKIDLEMFLAKHGQSKYTKKIMDLILKMEGLARRAKSIQMSIDVKGYTSNHSVSSGILHSKLLKQISQIKTEEQELIEEENSLQNAIENSPTDFSLEQSKSAKLQNTNTTNTSRKKSKNTFNSNEEVEMEEFISHVKKPEKPKKAPIKTKDFYKPFKNSLTQMEKNRSLEVQSMIDQFRRVRGELDSILSSYQGQKYRKKIMDLIIRIKAHINVLLSLQSSFKSAEGKNIINHSAKLNYSYLEEQLTILGKEKKEILENQKILKAKIAREQREMMREIYDSKVDENKDPNMVNLLLKLGLIKKKK